MDQVRETLAVSGQDGIRIFEQASGEWVETHHAFQGERITSVCADPRWILAGSRKGIRRTTDGGETWEKANQGLTLPYVRWLVNRAESDHAFAGTEPAEIFISRDGGLSWTPSSNIGELRGRNRWFLPYSPGAGCVRGFDFQGNRGYAAVEVGGALRSDDSGETWQLVAGSTGVPRVGPPQGSGIHADVHSIQTHSSSPDLVYAPTGGGFFRSWDGGTSWDLKYQYYCRAVWVDPQDADHLLLGPANSVDRGGRIEESVDGGESWVEISVDLGTPWPRHMVERFIPAGRALLAVLSNGEMLSSPYETWGWEKFQPDISGVTGAAYIRLEENVNP